MPDIARIGVEVDREGNIRKASKDLQDLAKTSKDVTKSTTDTTRAQKDASASTRAFSRDIQALEKSTGQLAGQMITGSISTRTMTQVLTNLVLVSGPVALGIGAVGGAVGGLLKIADLATQRLREHEVALALVGNSAGITTNQMLEMTDVLARMGMPLSKASKAIDDMVKGGLRGAETFARYGQTIVQFAQITGQSVDSVTRSFVGLQGEPLKAVQKLDEKMHFLTVSTLEQIKAAEEAGDRARASAIAMEEVGRAMGRVVAAGSNLGLIERAWKGIKDAAIEAANAILQIGRHSQSDQLRVLEEHLALLESQSGSNAAAYQVEAEALRRTIAEIRARSAAEEGAARAAEENSAQVENYNLLTQKYSGYMEDAADRTKKQRQELEALARAAGLSEERINAMLGRFDTANAPKQAKITPLRVVSKTDPLDTAAKAYNDQLQRQLGLSQKATESERLLYELQRGRLVGLAPARAEELQSMAAQIDRQREMAQVLEEEQRRREQTASQAGGIIEQMRTEEEAIIESYNRRRQIMLQYAEDTGNDVTQTLLRLEQERNDQLAEITVGEGGYWEQWLKAAELSMQDFDRLTGDVLQNISSQFGNAFEKMLFDSESLRDAIGSLAEGIARSMANALGQMAAQWLTYKLVSTMSAKAAGASGATAQIANAQATSAQAALAAYASTAAIPIVGPALAPAAAAAATAATAPMVAAIAAAATSSLAGMAHDGIDSVPKTGTWLLEKGERVTTSETSAKLDAVLSSISANMNKPQQAPNIQISAAVSSNMLRDFMLSDVGVNTFRVLLEENRAVVAA